MSAITGIFYRNGRTIEPQIIKKMNDKLSHRGPDRSAVWVEGTVALGHQMLWTTPESLHEKLPFYDEKSGLVITADARIDNRKELSEEMDIENHEDISDSYFILKAYEKWGEKCLEHLLGDFAFAIWNKNEEKLFCARDHIGVKPFYYYLSDDLFAFATEIKALFTIEEIPMEINEEKIAFHLLAMNLDKILTFYKNINALTAAHYLKINQVQNKITKYWELDPKSELILDSDEDYINAFRDVFRKAIDCRLRSALPIGFQLSGGLDSSSVVCMAKKILDDDKNNNSNSNRINTFSYVFDEFPQVDESQYINKVVNTGGIESHLLQCDHISPLQEMEKIFWHQEQPFHSVTTSISCKLFKKMYNNNIRVALTGHGGDEVIYYGPKCISDFAYNLQCKTFIREVYHYSKNYDKNIFKYVLNNVFFPLIPEHIKRKIRSLRRVLYHDNTDYLILNKNFAKQFGGEKYLKELDKQPLNVKTSKEFHYALISSFSNQSILELLDRNAAGSYIEPRYPFFDKRVIEFCYAIPAEMKFKFGWNRYILRAGMENILPKEIQWRLHKNYFTTYFQKNFLFFENNLLEVMLNDGIILEKYVDLNTLNIIYKEYISGNVSSSMDLWFVTILYIWLKEIKLKEKNI